MLRCTFSRVRTHLKSQHHVHYPIVMQTCTLMLMVNSQLIMYTSSLPSSSLQQPANSYRLIACPSLVGGTLFGVSGHLLLLPGLLLNE